MIRHLFTAFTLTLLATASAQTAKPTAVSIDGKAAQAITVNGKAYVSLDSLKAAGLNSNGTMLYFLTSPQPKQPAYKLSGCVGDWLWNGATRIRIDKVLFEEGAWYITYSTQAAVGEIDAFYQTNPNAQLSFADGDVISPGNPSYIHFEMNFQSSIGSLITDTAYDRIVTYRSDAESASDAPTKLVTPQIRVSGATYPAMTFDLTCKKP